VAITVASIHLLADALDQVRDCHVPHTGPRSEVTGVRSIAVDTWSSAISEEWMAATVIGHGGLASVIVPETKL